MAAQALRRIGADRAAGPGRGGLDVMLGGRLAAPLPDVALAYAEGAALAVTPATA